jgi:predicted permease
MFRNYLKIALRNIIRQKGYSFINIFGLAIAISCALLMLMWVQDELSWESFQKNKDTIYRVEQDQPTSKGAFHVNLTPYPMARALVDEMPEVENSTRYDYPGTLLMQHNEKKFYENEARCVDPSFLDLFTYPLVKGDTKTALIKPSSMVITEEVAQKYFGDTDPIGKTITLENKYPFTVTGIMRNIPKNTNLNFDILLSFDFIKTIGKYSERWGYNEVTTFVKLNKSADVAAVEKKITKMRLEHALTQNSKTGMIPFNLMPLKDLRYYARFGYGKTVGTIQNLYIFSFLALFILIIACINYMNLSTARAVKRYKEIGLRKVVGAKRKNIIIQFYTEAIILSFLAVLLSLIFSEFLLPLFNQISGKEFTSEIFLRPFFLIDILVIGLVTGAVSGTYPALFLSSFSPIRILREKYNFGNKSSLFRKSLVVFQFALSVMLIIGTIVMLKQLELMRNTNLGYDKEQLIYIPLNSETRNSYTMLKERLQNDPGIIGVTGTMQMPTSMSANGAGSSWDGKDPEFKPVVGFAAVDYDYFKTMKIPLAEGRTFSKQFSTDSTGAVVVNQALAKMINNKSALGSTFSWGNDNKIIGVARDFNYVNIKRAIEPLAIYLSPKDVRFVVARLGAGNIKKSIEQVRTTWADVNPSFPLVYKFFDEDYARMFSADEHIMSIFTYASVFAILIACLGLLGLASFVAELRTKEIGIRKVMGASISGITFMLSKEFILWIFVANLIAWPASYIIMNKILENYAARTALSFWIFISAFIITLLVALVTISYQTIKAANSNPVKALRYE